MILFNVKSFLTQENVLAMRDPSCESYILSLDKYVFSVTKWDSLKHQSYKEKVVDVVV